MHELTLKIDKFLYKDIDVYLSSLNGVEEIKLDYDNSEIYIKYNRQLITKNEIFELEKKYNM